MIDNVIYRSGNKIIAGKEIHGFGDFDLPVPRWDLFNLKKYTFPFSRRSPVATILTDFGCPFKCDFCPISTLGFKLRSINSVLEEMELLQNLGVRELFIRDQTFGVNKDRTMRLCKKMIERGFDFSWTCFSRVDVLDEERMEVMKKAGCHTIMFGIETVNEEQLKKYNKNIKISEIESVVRLMRAKRIRTVGTFIIGLPGDTRESVLKTIKFAKEIKLDYASFNVATPRFGTKLRKDSIDGNLINDKCTNIESVEAKPVWKKQELTNDELIELKKYANRVFYLRPTYLLKRVFELRSFDELRKNTRDGWKVLMKIIKK